MKVLAKLNVVRATIIRGISADKIVIEIDAPSPFPGHNPACLKMETTKNNAENYLKSIGISEFELIVIPSSRTLGEK